MNLHFLRDCTETGYARVSPGESMTVAVSPFAPRKLRAFAERKATLIDSPPLSPQQERAAILRQYIMDGRQLLNDK